VRDSRGRPLEAANVVLEEKEGNPLSARTDRDGTYRFSSLREGTYRLHATLAGCGEATSGPLALTQGEIKTLDLTLSPADSAAGKQAASEMPAFFDEPQFTVAGVTDPTNLGGHGSDTVTRTKESLARDVVSLSKESASTSQASLSAAQEETARQAVGRDQNNFEANRRLGELLLADGKADQSLPYLERASQLQPHDYQTSRELARAYSKTGQYRPARAKLREILGRQDLGKFDKAETHHLLADVEEKLGDPLEAAKDYRLAAEFDPSETDFFDWGAELLIHRAAQPAIEVFTKGNQLFPSSVRMLVGLGVALYARGSYEEADRRLCQASDLNPDDANPYLFLGKLQLVDTAPSADSAERLARFARLQPENPLANYYYAVSLWKQRRSPQDNANVPLMQSLLEKAVRLDPKLSAGYLQLGILYADQSVYPEAIAAYQKAIATDPEMAEAHYRLAQVYRRRGEKAQAEKELQLYEQTSKHASEQAERQRHEIQQFVYTLQDHTPMMPAK